MGELAAIQNLFFGKFLWRQVSAVDNRAIAEQERDSLIETRYGIEVRERYLRHIFAGKPCFRSVNRNVRPLTPDTGSRDRNQRIHENKRKIAIDNHLRAR